MYRYDTVWDMLCVSGDDGGGGGKKVYEVERTGVGHVNQCCKRIDL